LINKGRKKVKKVPITQTIAKKVLEVVDAGLVEGVGDPIPGQMCVEAAVCYAMGEDHNDQPRCVAPSVRDLKIALNDSGPWKSDKDRANGLRRLAIAQLGTVGMNQEKFDYKVKELAVRMVLPYLIKNMSINERKAAELVDKQLQNGTWPLDVVLTLIAGLDQFSPVEDIESDLYARDESAEKGASILFENTPPKQARQKTIEFAEGVVQILKEMKAPGTKFLFLTEGQKGKAKNVHHSKVRK
jgi:hypothetical protein